ncbi:MAG: hypothetical protein PHQ85_02795 [Eubacteriales bacterium]|nr:hypothetical protein [Eubacteriales bacterium]MDD4104766.1 hypothetical protein [Eubacteriales bacterium]MDD4710217.1 hypothetical protein [Eubacteriales bacterium]NLO15240.1 hypothetical protein [Clostridiales bacterium]
MRKALCCLICMLIAAAPCFADASQDAQISGLLRETQMKYDELIRQADAVMKEPITFPEPPSTCVSCADAGKAETDSHSLNDFQETFSAPEGPLCTQMLEMQRKLQLLGSYPGYEKEAALMGRLAQKALTLITDYGRDFEKVPAIALVATKTATDIQLLGLDEDDRSTALMDAVSAMYEKAIEEMFRRLVEEHDYAMVQPILDGARASLLLSGASGVDLEEILSRLQNSLCFELTINYNFEQTGNHRWVERAVLEVTAVYEGNGNGRFSGGGTGSMLSFVWDGDLNISVTAPDFPVQAVLENFDPCGAGVDLLLTPFHPLSETAQIDGEALDWPLLRLSWETAFAQNMREDGLYRFPLTLHNLDGTAVSETIEYIVPSNEVKMEISLVHKPK